MAASYQQRYAASLLKGLRAIGDLPGMTRRLRVYAGRRSLRSADGIDVWPAQRFARAVGAGELWP